MFELVGISVLVVVTAVALLLVKDNLDAGWRALWTTVARTHALGVQAADWRGCTLQGEVRERRCSVVCSVEGGADDGESTRLACVRVALRVVQKVDLSPPKDLGLVSLEIERDRPDLVVQSGELRLARCDELVGVVQRGRYERASTFVARVSRTIDALVALAETLDGRAVDARRPRLRLRRPACLQ